MTLTKLSKYSSKIDLKDYGFFGRLLNFILRLGIVLSGLFILGTLTVLMRSCNEDNRLNKLTTINLLEPKAELYISQNAAKEGLYIILEGWESIEGNYASPNGINMIFSKPIKKTIEFYKKTSPKWGDTFRRYVSVDTKNLLIGKNILFPSELFDEHIEIIECEIVGDLFFPTKTSTSQFDNVSRSIHTVVNIHPISDASYAQMIIESKKSKKSEGSPLLVLFICFGYLILISILDHYVELFD